MKMLLLGCVTALAVTVGASAAPSRDGAIMASQAWLALLDSRQYAESWSSASSLFRSKLAQAAWAAQVKSIRAPLGAPAARQLLKIDLKDQLPGAPVGAYAVVTFQADFAARHKAVETVVLMAENDRWQLAGYVIQ